MEQEEISNSEKLQVTGCTPPYFQQGFQLYCALLLHGNLRHVQREIKGAK